MNATNTHRTKRIEGKRKQLLPAVLLILLALVIPGLLWWSYANVNPSVTIPMPTMPLPNAYNSFVAAGNAVVDGDKIGFAIAPPGSSHTNTGSDRAYTPAEKAALVQENTGALRTLRRGFAYSYQSPPARSFSAAFPYYGKFRGMARLLTLEGQVKEARGDWAGAAASRLDSVELGVKIPRGGSLIGILVGIACQAIGRRPLWADVDHLNTTQAKAAARRMERLSSDQVPYANVLQEEKWGTQAGLVELFRQSNWPAAFVTLTGQVTDDDGKVFPEMTVEQLRLRSTPKRTVMRHYTNYMDRLIANAVLPYAAKAPAPPVPTDPVSAILCPVFTGADLKYTDNQAQNSLLTAALALRAYRLAHGIYPATLQALVPGYLSRVPADPFALSGPLRYKPQGATYLLYSVGPDGRDDGGKSIFDATKPAPAPGASTDPRRFVQTDSRGDIAAGVNLF